MWRINFIITLPPAILSLSTIAADLSRQTDRFVVRTCQQMEEEVISDDNYADVITMQRRQQQQQQQHSAHGDNGLTLMTRQRHHDAVSQLIRPKVSST